MCLEGITDHKAVPESAELRKQILSLWKEAIVVIQEAGVSKKAIDEATSQARALLKEGRSFETASLPRGFEKELARLEVSPQMDDIRIRWSASQGLEGFTGSSGDTRMSSHYAKSMPSMI